MAPVRWEVEKRQHLFQLELEFLHHLWRGPPPASAESPRPVPCLRLVLRVPDPPELPPEFSPLEPSKSWRQCLQVTEPMRQTALMPSRGLETVELIVSDGLTAIVGAAQMVYPAARHQRCLAHWFRNLEALTPRFAWFQRRKFRREFWWIWDAENQAQARDWARRFCARWRWAAPEMVEKFQFELEEVLSFFNFPAQGRPR